MSEDESEPLEVSKACLPLHILHPGIYGSYLYKVLTIYQKEHVGMTVKKFGKGFPKINKPTN